MIEVSSSDYEEKEGIVRAEIAVELNLLDELSHLLMSETGFEKGVSDDAVFQNLDIEINKDQSVIRIFFQIEQDLDLA